MPKETELCDGRIEEKKIAIMQTYVPMPKTWKEKEKSVIESF